MKRTTNRTGREAKRRRRRHEGRVARKDESWASAAAERMVAASESAIFDRMRDDLVDAIAEEVPLRGARAAVGLPKI